MYQRPSAQIFPVMSNKQQSVSYRSVYPNPHAAPLRQLPKGHIWDWPYVFESKIMHQVLPGVNNLQKKSGPPHKIISVTCAATCEPYRLPSSLKKPCMAYAYKQLPPLHVIQIKNPEIQRNHADCILLSITSQMENTSFALFAFLANHRQRQILLNTDQQQDNKCSKLRPFEPFFFCKNNLLFQGKLCVAQQSFKY